MSSNLSFAIANVTAALAIVVLIVALAAIIQPIIADRNEPLGVAAAVAISAGTLAFILFFAAVAGGIATTNSPRWMQVTWWLLPVMAWIAAAAIALFAARPIRNPATLPHPSWRMLPALALLGWVLAFDLLLCFEPAFHSDALWYHLTLPYYWVTHGRLEPHPTEIVAGYPLLTEMIYIIPVSWGLPFATRIVHLTFGLGVVLIIYGYLRDRLTSAGALAFAAAFFTFDSVNENATWANTDLARTFFLVVAAASLARYADGGRRRDLCVGAAIAGFAMSTHYLAIPFGNGLLTIALAVALARAGHRGRRIAGDLALFWAVSLAVFAPWPIKNVFHYGNPLYGLPGFHFQAPPIERLVNFFLGNIFFVGFAAIAGWVLFRRHGRPGDLLLAVYLIGYFVAGMFALPAGILRFYFPIYAVGLMLAGRLAEPLLARTPRLEVAVPALLLAAAIAMTAYQWHQRLYDNAINFVWRDDPRARTVIWHR